MMGHLCEAFVGFGLPSEFVPSGVKLVVFNYGYQYCYEKLCQQCVAIIVQLLLNTYILITLLLSKFSASHVCHGWLYVCQQRVWLFINHTLFSSPLSSTVCQDVYLYNYLHFSMMICLSIQITKYIKLILVFKKLNCSRNNCSIRVNPACVLLELECNLYDKVPPACCIILICLYLHTVLYKMRA